MNLSELFSKKPKKQDIEEEDIPLPKKKKGKKDASQKNLNVLESRIRARVLTSLSEDDEEEEDSSQCKGGYQEKIKFSGEMTKVCLSFGDSSVEMYDKKILSNLCLLAVYMNESSLEKAFYANLDKDTIYVFDGFNGNINIEEIPLEGTDAGEMAESYFEGEAHSKIDETIQAIRSNYTKESRLQE